MPSLKDLRNRIASVKATQKITKAMQMVAAAKLRRAQEAAEAARPYCERMGVVLSNLATSVGDHEGAPALLAGRGAREDGGPETHLLLVCTAERGLCGGFNSSIAKMAREHADGLLRDGKQVKILCVGKKGQDALKRFHASRIVDLIDLRAVKSVGFAEANTIGERVITMFEAGECDVCTLFFSRFKNVVTQIPTMQQLVPAEIAPIDDNADVQADAGGVYEYEPDEEAILNDLLPRNVKVQILRALLENAASEQGARMSAMDNATRNAGEMIDKLTLSYNRQRQAQITKELIEIISGAEAV